MSHTRLIDVVWTSQTSRYKLHIFVSINRKRSNSTLISRSTLHRRSTDIKVKGSTYWPTLGKTDSLTVSSCDHSCCISIIHRITKAQLSTLPSSVARCRSVFLSAEVSFKHFGTSAEMSWVRSVPGPKCFNTAAPGTSNTLPCFGKFMLYFVVFHRLLGVYTDRRQCLHICYPVRDGTAASEVSTSFSNRTTVRCPLHNISGTAVDTLLVG